MDDADYLFMLIVSWCVNTGSVYCCHSKLIDLYVDHWDIFDLDQSFRSQWAETDKISRMQTCWCSTPRSIVSAEKKMELTFLGDKVSDLKSNNLESAHLHWSYHCVESLHSTPLGQPAAIDACCTVPRLDQKLQDALAPTLTLCKKASNHHANLPLEMYSFTL